MKTILIMEDDAHQSRLMKRLLEYAGYHVLVEDSAQGGLQTAMSQTPDIILLDMGLPDMDGQTVAAWPKDTAREMARAYGCEGYISKPISAREFASQIAAYFKD